MTRLAALVLAGMAAVPALAAGPDDKGEGFLNLYVELCVQHLSGLEALRARLLRDQVPRLSPEDARLFLAGMEGDAWPVPYRGRSGNFVLALPAGKNLCMLHARRTDARAVERGFLAMVGKAPAPLVARRGPSEVKPDTGHGKSRTVSATWSQPGVHRRMQFILTVTPSGKAGRQALGTVAIVGDPAGQ